MILDGSVKVMARSCFADLSHGIHLFVVRIFVITKLLMGNAVGFPSPQMNLFLPQKTKSPPHAEARGGFYHSITALLH